MEKLTASAATLTARLGTSVPSMYLMVINENETVPTRKASKNFSQPSRYHSRI